MKKGCYCNPFLWTWYNCNHNYYPNNWCSYEYLDNYCRSSNSEGSNYNNGKSINPNMSYHCHHHRHQHGDEWCYCCPERLCCFCKKRKNQKRNAPIIWVIGGPGCGKATQCKKIVNKYKFSYFRTGDLLRSVVDSGSGKGQNIAKILETGDLVPTNDVLPILQSVLETENNPVGILIDGFPRNKDQGIMFEETISPVDLILYFDCSDTVLEDRVTDRAHNNFITRVDDIEKTIKFRIETFRHNIGDIQKKYSSIIKKINGEQTVNAVFNEACKYIDRMLANNSKQKQE